MSGPRDELETPADAGRTLPKRVPPLTRVSMRCRFSRVGMYARCIASWRAPARAAAFSAGDADDCGIGARFAGTFVGGTTHAVGTSVPVSNEAIWRSGESRKSES